MDTLPKPGMKRQLDKIEWWDVCRAVRPGLTWEEFEELWDGFERYKETKTEIH
jgi:hypothetical protein